MGLRDTYAHAIQTAKGKFQGNAEEREGKLYFKGSVATEAEKNEIWTAIKTIPTWQKDVVADIQVTGGPAPSASARSAPAQPQPRPQPRRIPSRPATRSARLPRSISAAPGLI